jgi:hypothetical protein
MFIFENKKAQNDEPESVTTLNQLNFLDAVEPIVRAFL